MIKPSFLAVALAVASLGAQAETLYALTTDNQLITLSSTAPTMGSSVSLSGLAASERLLGLDARPTNGLLYTLSNLGNIYTLNASTGVASFVATVKAPINGSLLGFDFNPNADLSANASLRVITSTGINYAVNVNPGANLGAVAAQTPISSTTESGATLRLTGAAYSNNDTNAATPTVLYAIDTASSALYATSAPAGGAYARVGAFNNSSLNVFGFDISATSGKAYAGLTGDDSYSNLYTIDLATGASTLVGAFGVQGNSVLAPVVGLTAAVPEPTTMALMLAGFGIMGIVARRRQA
jgi:Domain of unknown function (DUF4394)/PEP-CTERM motif